jgi:hypothetical protein
MRSSLALVGTCPRVGALLSLVVLGAAEPSIASPVTYNVDQTIAAGSVIGTIQTDGATGVLGSTDITGWNLELNGLGASINLTNSNSDVVVSGADLTASARDLSFNFSGAADSFLLFQIPPIDSGNFYYCDAVTTASMCGFSGATVVPQNFFDPSTQNVSLTGNQIIGTATVPAPLIGHGFLVVLAVGGVLLGGKLWEQSKARRDLGTA